MRRLRRWLLILAGLAAPAAAENYYLVADLQTLACETASPFSYYVLDAATDSSCDYNSGTTGSATAHCRCREGVFEVLGSGGGGGTLLYANTSVPAGNTVSNTATETAFSSSYDIVADTLATGTAVRVRLAGVYSTPTPAIDLTIRVKLDSTQVAGFAMTALPDGASNAGWWADVVLVIHSSGASGAVEAQGFSAFGDGANTGPTDHTPTTSTITVDTTVDETVTVTAEWASADASASVTLRELTIEHLTAAGSGGAGGGAITVEESDGSPSVADTTILRFDQDAGLTVTNVGGGIAEVSASSGNLTVITDTSFSADVDDYAPTGIATASLIRVSCGSASGPWKITGIAAGAGQVDGRVLRFQNVGEACIILFMNEHADSTAANRIITRSARSHALRAFDTAELWYDGTSSRWRVLTPEPTRLANEHWQITGEFGRIDSIGATTVLDHVLGEHAEIGTTFGGSWGGGHYGGGMMIGNDSADDYRSWGTSSFANEDIFTAGDSHLIRASWQIHTTASGGGISSPTERYVFKAGFLDWANPTGYGTDGAFFVYSDNINSGKWQCHARSDTGTSSADSGVTIVDYGHYSFTVEILTGRGLADFYINDTLVCEELAHAPSTNDHEFGWYYGMDKTVGGTVQYVVLYGLDIEILYRFSL